VIFSAMVDEVRRAGGMAVDPSQAGAWVNDRYKSLCVRADYSRGRVVIETVADQGEYALPEGVSTVHELRLETVPFRRVGSESGWDLVGGRVYKRGTGGFYYPDFDVYGNHQVALHPTPDQDGLEIQMIATVTPDDLSGEQEPQLPADFHRAVVEGALASAFGLVDENIATADRYEARFEQAVENLRMRMNKRLRGGPHFIAIEGVHYGR
jgi:hypothetical protein